MIWVVDRGIFHEASERWVALQNTFNYVWFDTDFSKLLSVDALAMYYIEESND